MNTNARLERIERAIGNCDRKYPPTEREGPAIDYDQLAIELDQFERQRAQRLGIDYERYKMRFGELYQQHRKPETELYGIDYSAWAMADEQARKEQQQ